jgi:ATP-dependent helicase/nuclease subunit A
VINRLRIDTGISITLEELSPAFNEALGCIQNPECRAVFNTDQYIDVHNEVPVMDCINSGQTLHVIDRLLVHTDFVWIVDYKSSQINNHEDINHLTEEYAAQMMRYKDIIGIMYPKKEIRCSILFTKLQKMVDL